jgi:ubiquinone/menaquinone biosynthesis C-methylase UbiE
MSGEAISWEASVKWLRQQPDMHEMVRDSYFDDPLIEAAERFSRGEEWAETLAHLPNGCGRTALDLGAGRGISSYALVKAGWAVTALDPDPSPLVGTEAIRCLSREASVPIRVIQGLGEALPFESNSFHLVYVRQTLHHAKDLYELCAEIWRVLRPEGLLVAARDHVISREADLEAFLAAHALHSRYGGENAFLLSTYRRALKAAGFEVLRTLGPSQSAINRYPTSEQEHESRCARQLRRLCGERAAMEIWKRKAMRHLWVALASRADDWRSDAPGRLYSFVAKKRTSQ